jgi:hypothetical protein
MPLRRFCPLVVSSSCIPQCHCLHHEPHVCGGIPCPILQPHRLPNITPVGQIHMARKEEIRPQLGQNGCFLEKPDPGYIESAVAARSVEELDGLKLPSRVSPQSPRPSPLSAINAEVVSPTMEASSAPRPPGHTKKGAW